MYAMKYMHKRECAEKGVLKNVIKEVEILSRLDYPFLVNLWFSFQGQALMIVMIVKDGNDDFPRFRRGGPFHNFGPIVRCNFGPIVFTTWSQNFLFSNYTQVVIFAKLDILIL